MSVTISQLTVNQVLSHESSIMATKYISAVALSCLVYDRLLNFDNEFSDIWLNFGRRRILKSLFLLGQYSALGAVIYVARIHGGFNRDTSPQKCQNWTIVTLAFVGLSLVGTEGIVIFRLRSLWHFNRPITRAIVVMVAVVSILLVVSMTFEAIQLKGRTTLIPGLGCLPTQSLNLSPCMLVMGVVFVIWDIFNVFIFTGNTFATPYLCTSDVLMRFRRDGGRYFLCLLVVHSLFLFSSAFGQNYRFSAVPVVLAFTALINARIFHGIALEAEKYDDNLCTAFPKTAVTGQ